MKIENAFSIAAPPDRIWDSLLDVERIVPCVPGAELIEAVDDRTWRGTLQVRFGPVALAFEGVVTMEERDDRAHRVALFAQGKERKGKGAASANVTSWMEARDDGLTTVRLATDVTLTGAVAQLSRGLLPEVSKKLTQQFAESLRATIAADRDTPPEPVAHALGGIRLVLLGIWAILKRATARLPVRNRPRRNTSPALRKPSDK